MSADMFNAPTARVALLLCIATLACAPPRPPAPPRSRPGSAVVPARADTYRRVIVHVGRSPSAIQRVNGALTVRRPLVPLDSTLAVRILDQRGGHLRGARVEWSV